MLCPPTTTPHLHLSELIGSALLKHTCTNTRCTVSPSPHPHLHRTLPLVAFFSLPVLHSCFSFSLNVSFLSLFRENTQFLAKCQRNVREASFTALARLCRWNVKGVSALFLLCLYTHSGSHYSSRFVCPRLDRARPLVEHRASFSVKIRRLSEAIVCCAPP